MTMNHSLYDRSNLDPPCTVRPHCSGSSNTPRRRVHVPNAVHVLRAAWYSQARILAIVLFIALVAFPETVSAAPSTLRSSIPRGGIDGLRRRQNPGDGNNNPPSNGSISMNVWLPILLVTIMFVVFSFITCIRRCAATDAAVTTNRNVSEAASNPASGNATRPRRRPRRTPSQISTKSLPAYMKEPGDHELVLFRGPSDMEDDHMPPHAIPALAEEDDEHPEMRSTAFDITLAHAESVETMPDSSTTNLIRAASQLVTRPPELHHATLPHNRHRSADVHSVGSLGSETELLATHQRVISVDAHPEPRGEAPAYTEAVAASTTISLNDPSSSHATAPPTGAAGGLSRFNFLRHNPFGSHGGVSASRQSGGHQVPHSSRPESPALHARSGSALSRFSSRESHDSHHSPSSSHNHSRSRSRSNSNLLRAFHSQSHAGSTISLDSISAPLTHTLTRAEFHAPRGGLLTPEQIKLITSKEGLERFGVPYGPDAVAAFSRPPDFESVAGEHQERSGASESGTGAVAQVSGTSDLEAVPSRSTSHAHASHGSEDAHAVLRASTDESYGMDGQTVQAYVSEGEDGVDEPQTARPMTPRTARPSRDRGSVARRR